MGETKHKGLSLVNILRGRKSPKQSEQANSGSIQAMGIPTVISIDSANRSKPEKPTEAQLVTEPVSNNAGVQEPPTSPPPSQPYLTDRVTTAHTPTDHSVHWGKTPQETIYAANPISDLKHRYLIRQEVAAVNNAFASNERARYHDAYLISHYITEEESTLWNNYRRWKELYEKPESNEKPKPEDVPQIDKEKLRRKITEAEGLTDIRVLNLKLVDNIPSTTPSGNDGVIYDGFIYGFDIVGMQKTDLEEISAALKARKKDHHTVVYLVGQKAGSTNERIFSWATTRQLEEAIQYYNPRRWKYNDKRRYKRR